MYKVRLKPALIIKYSRAKSKPVNFWATTLEGNRFGKLYIQSLDPKTDTCICKCDCGSIDTYRREYLTETVRDGIVASCKQCRRMKHKNDYAHLVNKRIGQLTILEPIETTVENSERRTYWKCKCDCGRIVERLAHTLLQAIKDNNESSCGECAIDNYKYLIGKEFGKLKVTGLTGYRNDKKGLYAICDCSCGNAIGKIIKIYNLIYGNTTSCGCVWYKHNMSNIPEYRSWAEMKRRCDDPNRENYIDYGGRGITYCSEWKEFENFYRDMGPKPKGYSLDRIDTNGNYEKDNCRWADKYIQARNRRKRTGSKNSKYIGVTKINERYTTRYRHKHIGTYATELDAAKAYDRAISDDNKGQQIATNATLGLY